MRLNELQGIDKGREAFKQGSIEAEQDSSPDTPQKFKDEMVAQYSIDHLDDVLLDMGWRRRTGGKFSWVYFNDSKNYILKVAKNDPCYMEFINYVMTHSNIHYPKVIGKPKKIPNFNNGFFIRLEKLDPLSEKEFRDIGFLSTVHLVLNNAEHFKAYARVALTHDLGYDIKPAVEFIKSAVDNMKEVIINPKTDLEKFVSVRTKLFCKRNNSFIKALSGIKSIKSSCHIDIHAGNLMKRDDTIVILDPVSPKE